MQVCYSVFTVKKGHKPLIMAQDNTLLYNIVQEVTMKTKTMVGTSIIIYTNKKTGISYDLVCTETDLNDVLRYKFSQ